MKAGLTRRSEGDVVALREMQLGKGTIAYKGESPEYYAGKRGLWHRVGRPAFVVFLAIAGVIFLYASFTSAHDDRRAVIVVELVVPLVQHPLRDHAGQAVRDHGPHRLGRPPEQLTARRRT